MSGEGVSDTLRRPAEYSRAAHPGRNRRNQESCHLHHGANGQSSCRYRSLASARIAVSNWSAVDSPHESLNICNVSRYAVWRQALDEYAAVVDVLDTPIKHNQYAAIRVDRINLPNPCFQCDSSLGHLIVKKATAPVFSIAFTRAWRTGSLGTAKGSRSMITQLSCSPCTSIPARMKRCRRDRMRRRSEDLVEKLIPGHGPCRSSGYAGRLSMPNASSGIMS